MGQPGLASYEPAFADEVAVIIRHALEHMQKSDGESLYLRLSTRTLTQPTRDGDAWEADALNGAYWLKAPRDGVDLIIAYCGALAPEAMAAHALLLEDHPGAGLLAVTSPDLLHRGWTAGGRQRWASATADGPKSHISQLLAPLSRNAGIVTLIDGSPSTLSWLGGVRGHRVRALGVESFGQTGDLPDLYRTYRLDADAILDAAADLALD
jgi:pyruvate dehydrogenase E1 component